jgi:hypothetical protein
MNKYLYKDRKWCYESNPVKSLPLLLVDNRNVTFVIVKQDSSLADGANEFFSKYRNTRK